MKNYMNKIYILLLLIALTVFPILFSNCSTKKSFAKNNIKEISANRLIHEIEQNNFVFDQFQTKFNAKVETPDANLSFKGQLRMKNDSIIWISVSLPIGVEVIRGIITKDSVFMINRTDKTYIKESIKKFKQIPSKIAEICIIQSIFVGNDITLKKDEKYFVEMKNGKYNLLCNNNLINNTNNINEADTVLKSLLIDPETFRICNLFLQKNVKKTHKVELNYDKFEIIENRMIPTEIELEISENQNFYIDISYSNIIINTEQDFKFSIPKKFNQAKL